MTDYLAFLDHEYKEAIENDCVAPESKLEFVGNHIFDFCTYDSDLDVIFAQRMIEVINAILTRATFEYQAQSQWHYENYILMCNMPFLNHKLSWGTSIRGAWIEDYGNGEIEIHFKMIPRKDLKPFLSALVEWVRE